MTDLDPERQRMAADAQRHANWTRWGTYLAERQWGTVREDYSADGTCWDYFPHDHARSRAYRWGEDGLLGFTDRQCRLCVAPTLWNGRDPILKERLFGLGGPEGNHGEDAKEVWHYLDAVPTSSYARALYRYPVRAYPYADLVAQGRRGRHEREWELTSGDAFADGWFEVVVEYAKAGPDDLLMRLTIANRSPTRELIDVLPTVWFRNTWAWGCHHEGTPKPSLRLQADGSVLAEHDSLGRMIIRCDADPRWLFTGNETNLRRLFGVDGPTRYVKDAFHRLLVEGDEAAVNPGNLGTKAAAWHRLDLAPGEERSLRLRWCGENVQPARWFGQAFDEVVARRRAEADLFYAFLRGDAEERRISREAYAGMLWSRQFYHLVVQDWLAGDPAQPAPPATRREGRNADWGHVYARDVLAMPDKWEYPWFAAWDLAFHCIPLARLDADFAKRQLELPLREWYLHPNGQIPAYEFALGDVNPPVHAWAAWRVYRIGARAGQADVPFLERVFQKLLLNFTWWVNRKDPSGRNLFAGGFLGLDNIGVFDRSRPPPAGTELTQADGTAWMAFYAARMLVIALELARHNPSYEDIASKFFEHFVAIADAINHFGGTGLWDEADGFYYDQLRVDGRTVPLRVRSLVGVVPLFACAVLKQSHLDAFPGFAKRLRWFQEHRRDLATRINWLADDGARPGEKRMLAIPSRAQLRRVLARLLDEEEFLSPFGVRSLSRAHRDAPFTFDHLTVGYDPGESTTDLFGGNSNWRGPVWFPMNHLLIESLRIYHEFYGDTLTVELPSGSGRLVTLGQVADEIARRLTRPFLPGADGRRPCHGDDPLYGAHPEWRDLLLFHEYFHGDDGRGCGAAHQTGWTGLVTEYLGK